MPKVTQYSKGSIPYFAGDRDDRIFILQKGILLLSSQDIETGKTVTEQVKSGEFFGVKSALGHFPREETATVLSESSVVVLSVQEFETLFSGNKQIILKMLRVFSGQLRQIHRKINAILNTAPVDQQTGMFEVAKSFYADELFRSCCDVCIKTLRRFPETQNKIEIARLYEQARKRADMARSRESFDEYSDSSDPSMKAFELPAFERFAKKYEPGEVIISEFEPGDTFYLIQSGSVQLIKYANGTHKNLDILKAGEFFGEMAILDNSPRSATCMAKTNVKCLEFSKENFEALITGNPMISLKLLKLFCKRIYDQKRRFRILVIDEPQIRLSDVFLMLDEMNPSAAANDRTRRFNVTVADMASWAGLSQEVTRDEINRFVEKRKIEVYDNYIIVNNINDMKRSVDQKTMVK